MKSLYDHMDMSELELMLRTALPSNGIQRVCPIWRQFLLVGVT